MQNGVLLKLNSGEEIGQSQLVYRYMALDPTITGRDIRLRAKQEHGVDVSEKAVGSARIRYLENHGLKEKTWTTMTKKQRSEAKRGSPNPYNLDGETLTQAELISRWRRVDPTLTPLSICRRIKAEFGRKVAYKSVACYFPKPVIQKAAKTTDKTDLIVKFGEQVDQSTAAVGLRHLKAAVNVLGKGTIRTILDL